jgi:hypothetical protein
MFIPQTLLVYPLALRRRRAQNSIVPPTLSTKPCRFNPVTLPFWSLVVSSLLEVLQSATRTWTTWDGNCLERDATMPQMGFGMVHYEASRETLSGPRFVARGVGLDFDQPLFLASAVWASTVPEHVSRNMHAPDAPQRRHDIWTAL